MNILFICSRNQWRSPTAEKIFKNKNDVFTRSAGTENSAKTKVTERLLLWADLIFVMEKKHKQRLSAKFSDIISEKEIIILDIPDEYKFMDPELVEIIKISVEPYL